MKAWKNLGEFRPQPRNIIKGFIVSLLLSITIRPVFITFFVIMGGIVFGMYLPFVSSMPLGSVLVYSVFSIIVLDTSVGLLFGRITKQVDGSHNSFKNFALGFFVHGFIFSVLLGTQGGYEELPISNFNFVIMSLSLTLLESIFVYLGCILGEKWRVTK